MSTISAGIFKKLTYKKQSALGTIATGGASTGQALRRTTSTIDLEKAFYKSNEIRPSQQRTDGRHGIRGVKGTINGELSVGTHQDLICAVLRQTAQAAKTTGVLTNVTAAVTTAPAGTFTRAAGSFLTDGFNVGDIIQVTGFAVATANNSHNFMITSLTALVMTLYPLDGTALVARASGDSVTIVQVGKKSFIPSSSQTREYYTIEHAFSDITQSEQFTDCVFTGFNLKMPSTGMCTISFPVMGLNMQTGTAAYFTSPTAATSGTVLASANGLLFIAGVKVGVVTSLDLTVNGNYSTAGGVVGSNVEPDIFPGSVDVTGTCTVLFDSAIYRDLFVNETEATLAVALTADNTASAGVFSMCIPRAKFNGGGKDDGEKGLSLTMPFVGLENVTQVAAGVLSTIQIQDSSWT